MYCVLSEGAIVPSRQSDGAAGYDLYSNEDTVIIGTRQTSDNIIFRKLVKTGVKIKVPEGTYGRVAARSGLGVKNGIHIGAGVIDSDYRGEIGVLIFNLGCDDFVIKKGDRIAQLIIEKIETPEIKIVENLDNTERGSNGFGSTGGYGAHKWDCKTIT